MLYLYRRVAFGGQQNADAARMRDLKPREWAMMAPVVAVVLWMGIYPESFIAPMRPDIAALDARIAAAAPESDSRLAAGAPRPEAANAMPHETHGREGEH
jgi:NADH-quinone oxidoreductase subunit M